jgi:hypothetical protein
MLPKISVILIILFSMLALACSSGEEAETPTGIRGSVMDDQGNSYPNVGLNLQPGNISATTDDTGDYSFNNLSPGDYQITLNPPKSS